MNNKPVTIYTTPTCGYCKLAKEYFKQNGVAFSEVDVAANQAEARKMIEKSGQMGVPVITVGEGGDEQIIVGYDRRRLAAALELPA